MVSFDLLELFLYIFPILEIIFIQLFFRPYLQYRNKFKLSVTDVVLPILLVGIHILSVRLLTYSLLPHFLFASFIIGLLLTIVFEHGQKRRRTGMVLSFFLKIVFLLGFVTYYVLAIARIVQFTRG